MSEMKIDLLLEFIRDNKLSWIYLVLALLQFLVFGIGWVLSAQKTRRELSKLDAERQEKTVAVYTQLHTFVLKYREANDAFSKLLDELGNNIDKELPESQIMEMSRSLWGQFDVVVTSFSDYYRLHSDLYRHERRRCGNFAELELLPFLQLCHDWHEIAQNGILAAAVQSTYSKKNLQAIYSLLGRFGLRHIHRPKRKALQNLISRLAAISRA